MSLRRLKFIEWLVLVAIAGVLVVLLTGGRSFEHGSFQLHVSLQGQSSIAEQIRWGLIRHQQFERLIDESDSDKMIRWKSTLPQPDRSESFPIRFHIDGRQTLSGWKYEVNDFSDTVLVEYTLPDGSRRYRGIPINRRIDQDLVEIEVPPDPPDNNTLIAPRPVDQ